MSDSLQENTGNISSGGNRRHSDKHPASNAEPLKVTIEPFSKQQYSYDAKHYRLDRARYRLEKKAYCSTLWSLVILIVYAGFTLIIAVASIISAKAAKDAVIEAGRSRVQAGKALDATIEQFRLEQRPWVAPSFPIKFKAESAPIAGQPILGDTLFVLQNLGKTPAIDVRAHVAVVLLDKETKKFDFDPVPEESYQIGVLFPGMVNTYDHAIRKIENNKWGGVSLQSIYFAGPNGSHIFGYGTITYKDSFRDNPKNHTVTFCQMLAGREVIRHPNGTVATEDLDLKKWKTKCEGHNDVHDE